MKNHVSSFLKIAALAAASMLPAVPLCAEDDEFSGLAESSTFADVPEWKLALGVDVLYAQAQEYTYYDDGAEKTDLYGANIRASWKHTQPIAGTDSLFPELVLLGGFAFGDDCDSVYMAQLSVGANLHYQFCEPLSVFVGARLGGGWTTVHTLDNGDAGLLFGFGGGIVWNFTPTDALALGVEYFMLDANSEAESGYMENPEPEYFMFTLGYRISF